MANRLAPLVVGHRWAAIAAGTISRSLLLATLFWQSIGHLLHRFLELLWILRQLLQKVLLRSAKALIKLHCFHKVLKGLTSLFRVLWSDLPHDLIGRVPVTM